MAKLLAPAGTVEMAVGAIDQGADAVYVGPLGWSRRPYESELSDDEIRAVIDHGASADKEVWVAMNACPSTFEVEHFLRKVRRYAAWGARGFVVTEPGAIVHMRRLVPDAAIHVSIGSGITNRYDAGFYRALGADGIIVPYRWGSAELVAAQQTSDIALEVFLFETVQTGMICPGKCIMSSYLKFRDWLAVERREAFHGSANRGSKECYRVCQTPWAFEAPDAAAIDIRLRRDARLMLEQIPQCIAHGVRYFKLSGRERPAPLISDLVRFYRKVIDGVLQHGQCDMTVYLDEMTVLRRRWVNEKRKRVDTLMSRAREAADGAVCPG